ncbi:MAG TPA: 3-phosphoshikimate 1-carboxyvinyltransferase [Vicinamibacterales bacterium]|nr:3-phosphoshikimate 1-carboxyvinyltransferase [Vicinamibacterales bacterium]
MASSIAAKTVRPARRVRGTVGLAGDKSISHRYALLGALAAGRTRISQFSLGADCAATLDCLINAGVEITKTRSPESGLTVEISGRGLRGLRPPTLSLDACNSGTTMRLLSGVLAAHPFTSVLKGDTSLTNRPMGRVIVPLEQMGARIESHDKRPPLTIHGSELTGIRYRTEVPSAQVKSAILLAGLQSDGTTVVEEDVATRNHTELALRAFGATVTVDGTTVTLAGGQPLRGGDFVVPGDISSAAFWLAAAAAVPGSDVEIHNVGLNPTRTALLNVLRRAGATIDEHIEREAGGEPSGTVRVRYGPPRSLTLGAQDVPFLIDEIPALAAWAAHGGELHVTGASELRVKESDRISALVRGFRSLGADVEEFTDGFHLRGSRRLKGGQADAAGDHRLAMAFAIAALGADEPSVISGADSVAISYPEFFTTLDSLCDPSTS